MFVAAGKTWVYNGTSWALRNVSIPDGTISTAQLTDGAVTAVKLDTTYAPVASPTFTGTVTMPSGTSIGSVSSTELGYVDGVTSAIQTQLNAKSATLTDAVIITGIGGDGTSGQAIVTDGAGALSFQTIVGTTEASIVSAVGVDGTSGQVLKTDGLGDLSFGDVAQAQVTGLVTALGLKAPLASPDLTGTPTAPTAVSGTNTTQLSTTAFVRTEVASLVDSSPSSLDTLNELALALGSDPNFATTVTNSLGLKAPLASPALTGVPVAPTAALATDTTQLATTAFVLANAPAPALTGPITSVGNATTITNAAVTAAKIASDAVTEVKILDGAVTQAKLGSGLSGITVTTTANRDTVIPSPFTGQFAFLTDTASFTYWDGAVWLSAITTVPTAAPTSVAVSGSPTLTTVTLTFSAGADGGSAITNYQYDLSTNAGSTWTGFTALSPADASSPITISGLAWDTTYSVKLKAVNALGTGSSESASVSFTTASLSVEYLVIAGGGSGGIQVGGGGGAGGYRTNLVGATSGRGTSAEAAMTLIATTYTVTVGSGGVGGYNLGSNASSPTGNNRGAKGNNSSFNTITSIGGGGGSGYSMQTAENGGSGGGADGAGVSNYGAGTTAQGYAGGTGTSGNWAGGGGGGAGQVGLNSSANVGGIGGAGLSSPISGSAVFRAGGGAGCQTTGAGSAGGNGGGGAGGSDSVNAGHGTANTGGGGGGTRDAGTNGSGGSGVVIVRYLTAVASGVTITGGTATTDGLYTVRTFTGSGSLVIT